jgi:AraC-like DNA-binding protein
MDGKNRDAVRIERFRHGPGQARFLFAPYNFGMHEVTHAPIFSAGSSANQLPPEPLAAARLWLPRLSLSACVFCLFSRDTTGARLSEGQRYSYFPSVPACGLVWVLDGEMHMLEPGAKAQAGSSRVGLPEVTFAGPFNQPRVAFTPGDARFLVLMLMPDAFHAMTGMEPAAFVNRNVPAREVLGEDWQIMSRAVLDAPDDAQRVAIIERFLDPLWARTRPDDSLHGKMLKDWSQGLAARAATSGLGRSLRQAERRIKQWTGQPMRDLRGAARLEMAFFESLTSMDSRGDINWAEVAIACGYADQAHFCRHTRQLCGFAPEAFHRHLLRDEAFWFYRLWSGTQLTPRSAVGLAG